MENSTVGVVPHLVVVGAGGNALSNPTAGATGTAATAAAAASTAASTTVAVWQDNRPLNEQILSYPATCFLVVSFIAVFVLMSRRRVSPAAMGSSYRHLFVRAEWWRVVTAAFTHGGLLHLIFNITALWVCRRMEADLGSWGYLLASAHLMILAEVFEKILLHVLLMTGRFVDEVSIGYSGVTFAWMTVISLKPEPSAQFAGLALGGFANVVFNLLAMRVLIRRSSFTGHVAGILAGLVFSAGGLEFARQRFWGAGIAVWALAIFFGSLKATTTWMPVPLVDYVDISRRNELGVEVVPLDWSNREYFEEYVMDNA